MFVKMRFLGDPSLSFTKALDLSFDGASIFGGDRSKRYALLIENGTVKEAHVESDNTGLNGNPSWPEPSEESADLSSLRRREGSLSKTLSVIKRLQLCKLQISQALSTGHLDARNHR